MKRTTSQITPILPLRPVTPAAPAQSAAPTAKSGVKAAGEDTGEKEVIETPARASKSGAGKPESVKPVEVAIPTPGKIASQPVVAEASTTKKAFEDVVPKNALAESYKEGKEEEEASTKARTSPLKAAPRAMQLSSKGQATVQASEAKAAPVSPTKPQSSKAEAQKRKHPGKLDIKAAVSKEESAMSSSATPAGTESSGKAPRSVSQTPVEPPSKTESPSGSVASPAAKAAPKTLRVVPTPKAETPPSAPATTPREPVPSMAKGLSRQPSVASINLPGTPSSEQVSISDNLSVASTSQSRANSPPPGKVGTAPTKAKTKSQLKKERQERAKIMEEEKLKMGEATKTTAEEPAQDPIISRKKKAKKEKETKVKTKTPAVPPTGESTPTASRPASPQQKPAVDTNTPKRELPSKERRSSKPSTPTNPTPAPPQSLPSQSPHEPSPPPTPTLTASQLLAELKATAPEIQKCIDSLFRSPASNHYKPQQNIAPKDLSGKPNGWISSDFKPNLTKEEVEALLKGTVPAVRYNTTPADQGNGVGSGDRLWDRGLITPTGAHLRALTEDLEQRFLDLEKAIRDLPPDLRFRPSKPQNEIRFPSLDLAALKRQFDGHPGGGAGRPVSAMEQMVQDGSQIKKGAFLVDEASKYLDEFVMPPATPPPSARGAGGSLQRGQQVQAQAGSGAQQGGAGGAEQPVPAVAAGGVDLAERQLQEARRVADERENALKKVVKKNRKLLGLG